MNAIRKRNLLIILSAITLLGIVVSLILYALRQNINLFYTPTQISHQEAPIGQTIRLGGMVEKGSVVRSKKSLDIAFRLTDFDQSVVVHYHGILPDLFREGQGVVTKGIMGKNGEFQASDVLAKHDANYMPPEVRSSLQQKKGDRT